RLLQALPGVTVVEPQGALWGDFQASRIDVALPRGGRLTLQQPRWQALSFQRAPNAAFGVGVHIERLQAASLDLQWVADPKASPAKAPEQVQVPVGLVIDTLAIDELRTPWQQGVPVVGLRAKLALQQPRHELQIQAVRWHGWSLQGQAQLSPHAPTLNALWKASGDRGEARVQIQGPLQALVLQSDVQVRANAQAPAQRLQAQATLAPFADWPVSHAQVRFEAFDLHTLLPAAPFTALTGALDLIPRDLQPGAPGTRLKPLPAVLGARAPARRVSDLALTVDVRNARPQAWDAAGLPIKRVAGQVLWFSPAASAMGAKGDKAGPQGEAELTVSTPSRDGRADGELRISGPWRLDDPAGTRLTLTLRQLDVRALHSQAAPLRLDGVVKGEGMAAAGTQAQPVSASQAWAMARWRVDGAVKALMLPDGGSLAGQAAELSLQGQWSRLQWAIDALKLQAGDTLASLSGQWQAEGADAQGPWAGHADIKLQAFDPARWLPWPRPPGDALQRTALNGQWRVQARDAGGPLPWAQRLELSAQGQLGGSTLLGVPVTAEAQASLKGAWQARLQATAAGNVLEWQAQGPALPARAGEPPLVPGTTLQWQLRAPTLQGWGTWAQAAGWQALQGRLETSGQWGVNAQGQWRSTGQLHAAGVQAVQSRSQARVALADAEGQWALQDGGGSSPWQFSLKARDAQWGTWALPRAEAALTGAREAHRLSLQGDVLTPERKLSTGARVRETARVSLSLEGGWQGDARSARWQGSVGPVKVLPLDAGRVAWLDVQPFALQAQWGPDGRQWRIGAAQAQVFGAKVQIEPSSGQGNALGEGVNLQASLAPLPVAELLGRIQPDAGWGGDLSVAGRLVARRAPGGAWSVQGELRRQAGDLSLREPGIDGATAQSLGVKEVRVGLTAQDGVWRLEPALEGRVLGSLRGTVTCRAQRSDLLPGPDDALSGQVEFKADNLRAASVWAPAGWRLGGKASATLQVAGTLQRPDLQGLVSGEGVQVANPLLGIQVTQGDMLLRLGQHGARIERFEARGGQGGGRLSATGEAQFGDTPTAQITLRTERFALLQRVDRRAVVSGQLQASLLPDALQANGEFTVDEGLIDISHSEAPTVGDDVNVVNRPGVEDEPVQTASPRKMNVLIALNLGEQLRLKGRGIDTHLGGQLRLTTPGNRPQLHGRVSALKGTYAAYGQKLSIERGGITFTGPVENPRLDILAMRPQSPTASASDVKVGVQISGTAQEPRV
ncbi:MAG: hypothetical protein RLZZ182_1523, partial [Pseudomonadota bacterium]